MTSLKNCQTFVYSILRCERKKIHPDTIHGTSLNKDDTSDLQKETFPGTLV